MVKQFTSYSVQAYSEPYQPSKIKFFVKIVHGFQSPTIFKLHLGCLVRFWISLCWVNQTRVKTNQDTSYINVLEHWKNLERSLITESNDLPAKLTLPTYPTPSLHVNFFLFIPHIFCVAFYSNNLFLVSTSEIIFVF